MDRRDFLVAVFLLYVVVSVDCRGNVMNASEVMLDNEYLTSTNGRFQLGFFNITNSTNRYLGIWNTDPHKTVVWIANGDHPIINGTGMLYLSQDGALSIGNDIGQIIWSTGSQLSRGEPQACLLDSGLLVLNDTKTGKFLWQSIYQLSDTLLPHVPLGYMKLLDTILEFQLSSWNITGIDPSPGQYVRKLDPTRKYELVTYKGSDIFYRTGPWDGYRWNGFPKMTQDLVKFIVTSSENGAYFWYEPRDPTVLWRLVLKSNGTTYRSFFNESEWREYWKAPDDSTPSYAACGPYGIYFDGDCKCCVEALFHPKNGNDWKNRIFSEGCERNVPLNGIYNSFVALRNVKLPDTINAVSAGNGSRSECESWCMKNSSCVAYANIEWQGCLAWLGDIIDMEQFLDEGATLYIRVASKREANNQKVVSITVPVAAFLIIILTAVILVWNRQLPCTNSGESAVVEMKPYGQVFVIFDYNTISAATDNFIDSNIVGDGQMGPVYRGVLKNRREIAVKKLSRSVQNGNEQLRNELCLLAILKHKNLVRLMGFCIQQEEIILCFEFMKNGSLDKMLFNARFLEEGLNWEQRHGLITKIASGLLYLHDDNGDTIVHRDIKPANILLDENMNPKISDFGIARLFEGDHSITTSTFGGTIGYIAPELRTRNGNISTKVDVYSFGVVILEIICGKPCPYGLVSLVLEHFNEGRILEIIDERLTEPFSHEELKRCIHLALLCLLDDPRQRPNMRQINLWLTSLSTPLPELPVQTSCWGSISTEPFTINNSVLE